MLAAVSASIQLSTGRSPCGAREWSSGFPAGKWYEQRSASLNAAYLLRALLSGPAHSSREYSLQNQISLTSLFDLLIMLCKFQVPALNKFCFNRQLAGC